MDSSILTHWEIYYTMSILPKRMYVVDAILPKNPYRFSHGNWCNSSKVYVKTQKAGKKKKKTAKETSKQMNKMKILHELIPRYVIKPQL